MRGRLRSPDRGFTLIEVMLVLVIVGILAGSISLGLDSLRGRDEARVAERLRRVLEATAQRATTRGQPLAVELLADGYRFRQLGADGNWQRLDDPPVFAERLLPADHAWGDLRRNGQTRPAPGQQLVFGQHPPEYALELRTPHGSLRYTGRPGGDVVLAEAGLP
nr:prepilin-type N-terminal cleavage/methylation domain-containing protein [Dechloromonas sp.]